MYQKYDEKRGRPTQPRSVHSNDEVFTVTPTIQLTAHRPYRGTDYGVSLLRTYSMLHLILYFRLAALALMS